MTPFRARFPILMLVLFSIFALTACDTAPAAPTSAPVVQVQPTVPPPPPTAVPPTAAPPAPTAVPPPPTAVPPAPRTLNVLVGAGKETADVNTFFPASVKVRVGDTVTWKLNTDELHTVAFSDGKAPPGVPPQVLDADPRFGASGKDVLPDLVMPVPGGGPTDLMVTPAVAFPSRLPGAPVESFGGTGFVNSGLLQNQPPAPNAPPNNSFSLTFPKAGVYQYICLVHFLPMVGTVEVVPPSATDVPSQSDIDAQAKAQIDPLLAAVDKAKAAIAQPAKDAGPNNTTLWYVHAGGTVSVFGDERAQTLEFGPKVLTIKSGDTVIWGSTYFHTVTFNPTPPPPDFVVPKPQPNGPPILSLNPLLVFPARPAASYDPTKLYNSGILGPSNQQSTWSLTFDKPGTYDYFCAVHRDQGMKATIVVQPK